MSNNIAHECFHCGERSVVWDSDFSLEDVGMEGNGIVQFCHRTHCNAKILYILKDDDEES